MRPFRMYSRREDGNWKVSVDCLCFGTLQPPGRYFIALNCQLGIVSCDKFEGVNVSPGRTEQ